MLVALRAEGHATCHTNWNAMLKVEYVHGIWNGKRIRANGRPAAD
jgi:hypothetical protein